MLTFQFCIEPARKIAMDPTLLLFIMKANPFEE